MLSVSPTDNNLWVSENAPIMDEGEASSWGPLNINVVELQSISTLTELWKKITCPFNEIKHTVRSRLHVTLYIDAWMKMAQMLIDILLLKVYQQVTNKRPEAYCGSAGKDACLGTAMVWDLCCLSFLLPSIFIYLYLIYLRWAAKTKNKLFIK